MPIRIDPEAALRCWAVEVTVAGHDYRIAPRPAAEWIEVALTGQWLDIVPGMVSGPGAEDLDDALLDGRVTVQACTQAAKDALSAAAGMRWWSAVALIQSGMSDPAAAGELALAGVSVAERPLAAVLQALYGVYTRNADRAGRAKFDATLDRPPPGVPASERYDPDAAADAFESMAAARGVR